MKRWIAGLLSAAMLLSLFGCVPQQEEQDDTGAQKVYYIRKPDVDHQAMELTYETQRFGSLKGIDLYTEIIDSMMNPQDLADQSAIPDTVELQQIVSMGNMVIVTFSEGYSQLPEIEKSMVAAAVTLSLCSSGKADYVKIISSAVPRSPMEEKYYNKDSFMLDDSAIQYSALGVTLYYIHKVDSKLIEVQRVVKTETGDVTPAMVLDALLTKPGSTDMRAPFDGAAQVGKADVEDAVCQLDLIVGEGAKFGLVDVYAVVNTLCNHPNINCVQMTIDGRKLSEYGIEDCDGILSLNLDYVE